MPRGRIVSNYYFDDPGVELDSLAPIPARYFGIIEVTEIDGDHDLVKHMNVAYVSSFPVNPDDYWDFDKLKDSDTGLFCAALYVD